LPASTFTKIIKFYIHIIFSIFIPKFEVMRALKFIGLFILLLAIVVAALAFISPKKIEVRRKAIINSSPSMVREQMFHTGNWKYWNPFYEQDTTLQISYADNNTTGNQDLKWKSNKEIPAGNVTADAPGDVAMNYHVKFPMPGPETLFSGNGQGFMSVEDVGGGKVKATWNYSQEVPFPANALILLWNADNSLGEYFENGLQLLKMYIESGAAAVTSPPVVHNNYKVSETVFPAQLYAVARKKVAHKDLVRFFSNSYDQLLANHEAVITGARIGIFYKWDMVNKTTDVAAGFPVSEGGKKKSDYVQTEESPAYMTVHKGGYGSSAGAHEVLGRYLDSVEKTQSMVIEEYITGPFNEQDSTKWITNVYYLAP